MAQAASTKPPSNMGDGFDKIFPGASQKVAFDGSVASANAFGARTSMIQISSTQDCHIKMAVAPVALADGSCMFLPKGFVMLVGVRPGDKIAAIKDSVAGSLFVTEGA